MNCEDSLTNRHTELLTCLPTPENASVAPLVAVITWLSIGIAPKKQRKIVRKTQRDINLKEGKVLWFRVSHTIILFVLILRQKI